MSVRTSGFFAIQALVAQQLQAAENGQLVRGKCIGQPLQLGQIVRFSLQGLAFMHQALPLHLQGLPGKAGPLRRFAQAFGIRQHKQLDDAIASHGAAADRADQVADIAIDPVEGTKLLAYGRPNAISVVGATPKGSMYDPGPSFYMEKLVVPPEARNVADLDAPVPEIAGISAGGASTTKGGSFSASP